MFCFCFFRCGSVYSCVCRPVLLFVVLSLCSSSCVPVCRFVLPFVFLFLCLSSCVCLCRPVPVSVVLFFCLSSCSSVCHPVLLPVVGFSGSEIFCREWSWEVWVGFAVRSNAWESRKRRAPTGCIRKKNLATFLRLGSVRLFCGRFPVSEASQNCFGFGEFVLSSNQFHRPCRLLVGVVSAPGPVLRLHEI